jgi:hypothetical protein|tara:strand:- start:740 stop:868 length:129 start_codon:yes stop_codon:yes gene_type:complete
MLLYPIKFHYETILDAISSLLFFGDYVAHCFELIMVVLSLAD